MPANQSVRALLEWSSFERTFSNQKSSTRYIREIIYGKRRATTYWEITTEERNNAGELYNICHDKSSRECEENFRRPIWNENMGRIWFQAV